MNLYRKYHPITATPFKKTDDYVEMAPCDALKPYIRCFWGSETPCLQSAHSSSSGELVIPDTCVDIIYHIDHTENKIVSGFCGINDESFYSRYNFPQGHLISVFSVRFYAWGAYAFSEDTLKGTVNGYYDAETYFHRIDRLLREQLLEKKTLTQRAHLAEQLLLDRFHQVRQNNVVNSTVENILMHRGNLSVTQMAQDAFVSSRQLERLFDEYVGITPKKLSNLIRYQFLWNEVINHPEFDVLDAVCKYGYTDESHLMREFKRYHSMGIRRAISVAYENVGNIQDFQGGFL